MRWNPLGRTWSRKRLMNSSGATVIEADQSAVRDGDTVGVASEIGEHRLGPRERGLGVNEPLLLPQRREIGGKGRPVAEAVELAEERQPARRVGVGERSQEEPPEQARSEERRIG